MLRRRRQNMFPRRGALLTRTRVGTGRPTITGVIVLGVAAVAAAAASWRISDGLLAWSSVDRLNGSSCGNLKFTMCSPSLLTFSKSRASSSHPRTGLAAGTPGDPASVALDQSYGLFLVGCVAAWLLLTLLELLRELANPVNDVVPDGEVPSLKEWLDRHAPPRSDSMQHSTGRAAEHAARDLVYEPVITPWQLWEVYSWSTAQIVEEVPSMLLGKNYVASLFLQLASFPKLYSEWSTYEECVIDEVELGPEGTVLGQVDADKGKPPVPIGPPKKIVLECGKMLDTHGVSMVARPRAEGGSVGNEWIGAATLIVKRLPEECHVTEDGDASSVVCNVDWDTVESASGLEAVGYLEALAVGRKWRGSGVADQLLAFVEGKARTWGLRMLTLHVHRDNWPALRFYSKRGFECTSDWMGWGESFFLLLKPLPEEAEQRSDEIEARSERTVVNV